MPDSGAPNHYRKDITIIHARSNGYQCIIASMVNAVYCMRGDTAASNLLGILTTTKEVCTKLGSALRQVHQLKSELQFQKVSKTRKLLFTTDPPHWLTSQEAGVYIVRLEVKNVLSHCIAVDCNRKLVFDNVEKFAMGLSREALHVCVNREPWSKVFFCELYELIEQL